MLGIIHHPLEEEYTGQATLLIDRNRGKTGPIAQAERIRNLRDILSAPAYQDDSGPEGYMVWRY